ncbi:hypothetical protein [Ornithinibacillus halotolerans]|uniref:Uncharacterized protein n=1 Tax=Ornithinibacillus halotolerans TaxID=1274357 RepID=A0A916S9I1_9BACI|nr:hypothetical protein [Ornithinibacillus halotolerans]GGA90720.1 hypothetical protein GCM10008025_36540 [Ornithinibacillus halotolerans]
MSNIIRFLLISIMALSILALLIVYFQSYIPEFHMAKALPLAIVAGLSTIAVAIYEKKK